MSRCFVLVALAACQPPLVLNTARFSDESKIWPAAVLTYKDDTMHLSIGDCANLFTFEDRNELRYASCETCPREQPVGQGWLSTSKQAGGTAGAVTMRIARQIEVFEAELMTGVSTATELSGTIEFKAQNGRPRAVEFRAQRSFSTSKLSAEVDAGSLCGVSDLGALEQSNCCFGPTGNGAEWPNCAFETVCRL